MEIVNFAFFIILIIFCTIAAILYCVQKEIVALNDKISQGNDEGNKSNKVFKRNHSNINPVSFSNPIQARKNLYDDYKNEKGLYEPVTPRKGIEIKEDK